MATQIDNATMTVTVNEDVKLNGQQVGSKIVQQIGGINEASRRIFSVSTAETEILALSSSAGAGTYVTSNLQYIRVTNLDDTNFVRLTFASGSLTNYMQREDKNNEKLDERNKILERIYKDHIFPSKLYIKIRKNLKSNFIQDVQTES